ncbi:MAG: DUF1223 domain-containing protein [Ferruginibacter sp.]
MKKFLFIISALAAIVFTLMITVSCRNKAKAVTIAVSNNNVKGSVLMELFTSQGCSSCPPADELLGKYAMGQDDHIIPIAFHVDYWNRLGWKDSFSMASYSQRQRDYAAYLSSDGVYTPQVILNGQKEMVGSDEEKIAAAIGILLKEPSTATVSINTTAVANDKVNVSANISGSKAGLVINAALIEKKVMTHIKAGENSGVKLWNYNVVRDFKTAEANEATANFQLEFPSGKAATEYSVVVFLQDKKSGKIFSAVKKNL